MPSGRVLPCLAPSGPRERAGCPETGCGVRGVLRIQKPCARAVVVPASQEVLLLFILQYVFPRGQNGAHLCLVASENACRDSNVGGLDGDENSTPAPPVRVLTRAQVLRPSRECASRTACPLRAGRGLLGACPAQWPAAGLLPWRGEGLWALGWRVDPAGRQAGAPPHSPRPPGRFPGLPP